MWPGLAARGTFPGVCSLLQRVLLHFIHRMVQCEMQKPSRKQKATLPPPPHPPWMCLQEPGCYFGAFLPRRNLLAVSVNRAAQCHGFDRRG